MRFISPIARRAGEAEIARPEKRSGVQRGALKPNVHHGFLATRTSCRMTSAAKRPVVSAAARAVVSFVRVSMAGKRVSDIRSTRSQTKCVHPLLLGGGHRTPTVIHLLNYVQHPNEREV